MTNTATKDMQIAKTIIDQLGGNKFLAMTGAKNLTAIENGLRMTLPRNISGANRLGITLNGLDLYDMSFYKLTPDRINKTTFKWTPGRVIPVEKVEDIYYDQLQSTFTRVTGMDTRLF